MLIIIILCVFFINVINVEAPINVIEKHIENNEALIIEKHIENNNEIKTIVQKDLNKNENLKVNILDAKFKSFYDIPLNYEIQNYIFKLCKEYDLSISLVIAVMELESEGTFDNNLICYNTNGTYDQGIMQLNSRYHDWFGQLISETEFDAGNVYHNIHAGIKYLSILMSELDDNYYDDELIIRCLNSYNMGMEGYRQYVSRTGQISRSYSDRILEINQQYQFKKGDN